MAVLAIHPVTGAEIVVDEEAMTHLRASGWLKRSEHEENQAAAAAAEAKSAKSAAPAAPKEK